MEKVAGEVNLFTCSRAANKEHGGNGEEEKSVGMTVMGYLLFCFERRVCTDQTPHTYKYTLVYHSKNKLSLNLPKCN